MLEEEEKFRIGPGFNFFPFDSIKEGKKEEENWKRRNRIEKEKGKKERRD